MARSTRRELTISFIVNTSASSESMLQQCAVVRRGTIHRLTQSARRLTTFHLDAVNILLDGSPDVQIHELPIWWTAFSLLWNYLGEHTPLGGPLKSKKGLADAFLVGVQSDHSHVLKDGLEKDILFLGSLEYALLSVVTNQDALSD
jgi:hypothetical protein